MAWDFDFDRMKDDLMAAGRAAGDKAMEAGRAAGDKANEAASIAKIRLDIRSKEDFIQKQYAVLGKAYYEAHKEEEQSAEDYEAFRSIREAQEAIASLNDELLNAQGSVCCPACGKKQSRRNAFCSGCGAALQ